MLLGFNYLFEVFRDNWEIKVRVANLLANTHAGTGGWKEVARVYNVEEEHIDHLDNLPRERGEVVIEYLTVVEPTLTVYEFCKRLKDIKRNDIVLALSDHLISGSN